MYVSSVLLCLVATGQALNIVQSNDDGWAEINIRAFYNSLTAAGYHSLISAPAENESGTGSSDAAPTIVGSSGCEYGSCPPGSPPYGKNVSMPAFNYVNSYPVTSMRYGIQNLSTCYFKGKRPQLAVSGPNVGDNLGFVTLFSGTVGAAAEAAKEGVPAVAFSGATGTQTAWNATQEDYVQIYADLSTHFVKALTRKHRAPFLPNNTWINVNYSAAGNGTNCTSIGDFSFILSRINTAIPLITPADVTTCNNAGRLPTEGSVIGTSGCYASVSVGNAQTKLDATATEQAFVLGKLKRLLTCLPSS